MDAKKLKALLDVIFEYWYYTVGSLAVISAFWLFFTKQIDKDTFAYVVGAVITLKWVWKPKSKTTKTDE